MKTMQKYLFSKQEIRTSNRIGGKKQNLLCQISAAKEYIYIESLRHVLVSRCKCLPKQVFSYLC